MKGPKLQKEFHAPFGHWECDLVIDQKTSDDEVLLTLAERMSREYWMIPLSSKEAASVMEAFEQIRMERHGGLRADPYGV